MERVELVNFIKVRGEGVGCRSSSTLKSFDTKSGSLSSPVLAFGDESSSLTN